MKTWIYQGTPDKFDIEKYSKYEYLLWLLNQEEQLPDIRVGDMVYLWRSNAGDPE